MYCCDGGLLTLSPPSRSLQWCHISVLLIMSSADAAKLVISRLVKRWMFDPLVTTVEEAKERLIACANAETGTAIAVDLTAVVLTDRAAGTTETIALDSIPAAYFVSHVSVAQAVDSVATRVAASPFLAAFRGWDVNLASPGDVFETTIPGMDSAEDAAVLSFVSSERRESHYFDLVAYDPTNHCRPATYKSTASFPGLEHSGDLESLLHLVRVAQRARCPRGALPLRPGQQVVVGVVGFCRRPLARFQTQLPIVCIPSPADRVIHVVPCPLDGASVQEHTMACLVSGLVAASGRTVSWVVAERPVCCSDVNTSDHTDTVMACYDAVAQDASRLRQRRDDTVRRPIVAAAASSSEARVIAVDPCAMPSDVAAVAEAPSNATLVMFSQGVPQHAIASTAAAAVGRDLVMGTFGKRLRVARVPSEPATHVTAADPDGRQRFLFQHTSSASHLVLPIVAGVPLVGPAPLALGRHYETFRGEVPASHYRGMLLHGAMVIVHVSDKGVPESAQFSATALVRGCFVVHPTRATAATPQSFTDYLNHVDITAVTAMAGPLALVVVEPPAEGDAKRYFYRGVLWPGLFPGDELPAFGADVSDVLSDASLLRYGDTSMMRRAPVLTPRDSRDVAFPLSRGTVVPLDVAVRHITAMTCADLCAAKADITDFLTQASILLDTKAMQAIVRQLLDTVQRCTEGVAMSLCDDQGVLSSARMLADGRRRLRWLVDLLGRSLSVSASSMRHYDINRLQRRAAIASNVADAAQRTLDEVCDLMDATCDPEIGCAIAHFGPETVPRFVAAVASGRIDLDAADESGDLRFHEWGALPAAAPALQLVAELPARLMFLDATTVAAVKQLERVSTALHSSGPTNKGVSLALVGLDNRAALPLPVLTCFVSTADPTVVPWSTLANEPNVATFRILLRGTISSSGATRESPIAANSRHLGVGLAWILVKAMRSIVPRSGVRASPSTDSVIAFDDTRARLMRGLFGLLLTTLASGEQTLSSAWQLVSRGAVDTDGAWKGGLPPAAMLWLFAAITDLLPFTGWQGLEVVRGNAKALVAAVVRTLTDPVTGAMRGKAAAAAAPVANSAAVAAALPHRSLATSLRQTRVATAGSLALARRIDRGASAAEIFGLWHKAAAPELVALIDFADSCGGQPEAINAATRALVAARLLAWRHQPDRTMSTLRRCRHR